MKKTTFLILVYFICLGSVAQVREALQDSAVYEVSGVVPFLYDEYQDSTFLVDEAFGVQHLSNFGQYTLLTSMIDKRMDPVRFGEEVFLANGPNLLKNAKPYSQLSFSNTYNEGQLFRAIVSQGINSNWMATASFDRNNATGQYQREAVSSNFGKLHIARLGDRLRWRLLYSVKLGSLKRQVNGGIADPMVFEQNLVTNRSLMAISLGSAEQKMYLWDMDLSSPVLIKNLSDSLATRKHWLKPELSFKRTYYIYQDQDPLLGYYQQVNLDSARTLDSNALDSYRSAISYIYESDNSLVEFGLSYQEERSFQNYVGHQSWLATHLKGSKDFDHSKLLFNARWNLGDHKGYEAGLHFEHYFRKQAYFNLSWCVGLDRLTEFNFKALGNHHSWEVGRENPYERVIGTSFGVMEKFDFSIRHYNYSNRFYYKGEQLIQGDAESLLRLRLKGSRNFGNWRLEISGIYQPTLSLGTAMMLPEWVGEVELYYSDVVFDGALPFKVGVHSNMNSAYHSPNYFPALNVFMIQSDFETPAYPYSSIYLEIQIKSAFVKLKMNHVNQGVSPYNYYINSQYILPDRSFLMAVRWNFLD